MRMTALFMVCLLLVGCVQQTQGPRTTQQLTQSEEGKFFRSFIDQAAECSNIPSDKKFSRDFIISVEMKLNRDGTFQIPPNVTAKGGTGNERLWYGRAVKRFIVRCEPYETPPLGKYRSWKEITLSFHASEMFN